MPTTQAAPANQRYLIHAREPGKLHEFIEEARNQSGIELVEVIGPPSAPQFAVVAMSDEAAQTLAQRFRATNHLTIEPDRPLSLFTGSSRRDANGRKNMAKSSESSTSLPPEQARKTGDGSTQTRAERMEDARAAFTSGGNGTEANARAKPAGHTVSERKGQFLISPRKSTEMQLMGIQPLQFSMVEQALRSAPDIEVVDTVGPKDDLGALSANPGDAGAGVIVARMTGQKAGILNQQAQGRLIVERDQPLGLLDMSFQMPPMVTSVLAHAGPAVDVLITVLGKNNSPLPEAEVYLFGSLLPVTATTDQNGEAKLSLFGESPQSLRALYVKPKADYWSFYQTQPDISTDEPNIVGLRAISDWPSLSGFPAQQTYGWGQRAMRLDQLPPHLTGHGIKIAIIDSGADNGHHDLSRISQGFDIINKKTNPNGWNEDQIAHGSHCAGVIAGADTPAGVRGFAPDAEIHVCKLFPGGQVSQLIEALEYCIEKQVDVVNLSLGGAEPSEALEQQILRAKRAGIACIAAAGNSGSRVQYPASSPNVLAVAAIGQVNAFPPDSYHMQTLTPAVDQDGFFAAKFSCFGPEIAVCAPGVAIASSVPPNNYAVWDGTSMAAPHVTGLAALVLAHHPDFQGPFRARSAERVERLFEIIRYSTRPISLGDVMRTGFGLPDVLVALGLQPSLHAQPALQQEAALGAMLQRLQQPLGGMIGGFLGNPGGVRAMGGMPYPFALEPRQPPPQQFMPQMWMGGAAHGFGNAIAGIGPALGGAALSGMHAMVQAPAGLAPQGMQGMQGMHAMRGW